MSQSNQKTLRSYEAHIDEYIEGTPQEVTGDVKVWIDKTLERLQNNAKILEIGSAFGRDAAYMESCGYKVERSDAVAAFVDYLRRNGYEDARTLNILSDEIGQGYDLIFADAVLLHLTKEEMMTALSKIYDSLDDQGVLSFSLKEGAGEEWSDAKLGAPRYFQYWSSEPIRDVLAGAGFRIVDIGRGSSGRNNAAWLHIISVKDIDQ